MAVDDAWLQHQSCEVDHFARGRAEIRPHSRNHTVFNGDVANIVDAVERINDLSVFQKQVKHRKHSFG